MCRPSSRRRAREQRRAQALGAADGSSRSSTPSDGLDGHVIGVWGLVYKQGTDTLRRSSAVELCRELAGAGAAGEGPRLGGARRAGRPLPGSSRSARHRSTRPRMPSALVDRDRLARVPRGRPGTPRGGDADADRRRRERLPRARRSADSAPCATSESGAGRGVTARSRGQSRDRHRGEPRARARDRARLRRRRRAVWLVCARDAAALDRARTELESVASEPGSVADDRGRRLGARARRASRGLMPSSASRGSTCS